jgi:hypothetical protein
MRNSSNIILKVYYDRSWGSSVTTVAKLQARQSEGSGFSFLARGRNFCPFHSVHICCGARTAASLMDTWGWYGQDLKQATRHHLMVRVRICGAVSWLPPNIFMLWCIIKQKFSSTFSFGLPTVLQLTVEWLHNLWPLERYSAPQSQLGCLASCINEYWNIWNYSTE